MMPLPKYADYATLKITQLVTGTIESVVLTSPGVITPSTYNRVFVAAWAMLNPGSDQTSVFPRLRSGTGITDPVIGANQAQSFAAAANQHLQFTNIAEEGTQNRSGASYVYTLQQAGGANDGNAVAAAILVLVF